MHMGPLESHTAIVEKAKSWSNTIPYFERALTSGISVNEMETVLITARITPETSNVEPPKPRKSILKNGCKTTTPTPTPSVAAAKKYQDSVVLVSQLMRETSKEKTSSSSSSYGSPVGSPTPVTCAQHCCGSLFVRCSEHGRSQLLQTFSDPTSPLSRQTFQRSQQIYQPQQAPPFYKYPTQRSNSLNNNLIVQKVITAPAAALPKNYSDDSLLKRCLNGSNGAALDVTCTVDAAPASVAQTKFETGRFLFDEKSVSKVLQVSEAEEKETDIVATVPRIGLQTQVSAQPKTLKPILVRRHSSLPGSDPLPVNLSEILEDKFRRRSCSEARKSQKRSTSRPGTPVGDGGEISPVEEVRYYVSSSSSCSDILDDVDDSEICAHLNGSSPSDNTIPMGNGASHCNGNQVADISSVKRASDVTYGQSNENIETLDLVSQIRQQSKEWEVRADALETEVLSLKRELKKKDQDNVNLQREIHKLKSVLQQASSLLPEFDLLSCLQDSHGMPGQCRHVIAPPNSNKKQGVSGESSDHGKNLDDIQIQRYEKDFRSKQLIKDAIMENDFLKNLDSSQLREIVESMFSKEFNRGSYVIREGDAGCHLYVSAEGELEVIKDGAVLGRMGPRKAFGELAILYNCRRTASIRVVSDAKVWVLDRRVFQLIMMRTGLQRLQDNINFLRSVPLLHQLNNDVLSKIADVLEVEFYPSDAHIIRQGANGETFFIIRQGSVKVTQRLPGRREDEEIRVLTKGDYFGEQALLKEDIRTASVIALSPGVECLTLDRDSFIQLIGDLSELHEKHYGDDIRGLSRPSSAVSLLEREDEYDYIRLDDLDVVATLGVGGFGRVELVQYIYDKSLTFALKCLKKQHIVNTDQQEHMFSERNIMKACNCGFICRLYKTFRDSKYVYMMLEACLGGEVWTILRDRGSFDDNTTRFYTACVLEAFEYLHARGIIYRDLKPENLLLDNHGYVKLADFGFSKRLGFSAKTWTFCGTPEYVAPEIILNKGHDRAVDYWSLGVLMHELLTGTPPFTATGPMKTYKLILNGINMIDFPKQITRTAQSLIKGLCRQSPSERLGYQRSGIDDIKNHKWFQGFHWDGLEQRTLVAPIIPQVRGPLDTSNFDVYPNEHDIPGDEFSNWDAEF